MEIIKPVRKSKQMILPRTFLLEAISYILLAIGLQDYKFLFYLNIGCLILLLFRAFQIKQRIVYEIIVNEKDIIVCYLLAGVIKCKKKISVEDLYLSFVQKKYFYTNPKTLQIFNGEDLIAEINYGYNYGWTPDELNDLYKRLQQATIQTLQ